MITLILAVMQKSAIFGIFWEIFQMYLEVCIENETVK